MEKKQKNPVEGRLTLTRRVGEKIVIGGNIVIEVLEVGAHNTRTRLGITAPVEVSIRRLDKQ